MELTHAPRYARFLLGACVPPGGLRENIIGDLEEEFATVILPRDGEKKARRWYWTQALRSAGPLMFYRLADWKLIATIVVGWLTILAVFVGLVGTSVALFEVVTVPVGVRVAVYLATLFSATVVGGYVVRSRQRHDPLGPVTLCVAMLLTITSMFVSSPETEPFAWWVTWALIVVSGVFVGSGFALGGKAAVD